MKKYIYSISCMFIMFALALSCVCQGVPLFAEEEIAGTAKSAILMDYNSGEILYEKNSQARLPVASMVKLMTILITFEEIDAGNLTLDTKIQTTENASRMGGSQVFIDPYVSYCCEDLLKSVIIASANDASVALAEHISGSESEFVRRMNQRALGLGLKNTLYANCTGLPAPEQYSCAEDCAILLKTLSSHEGYHKYSSIWMDNLVHPSGRKTELVNTNKLIRYYNGCDCGKTGSTNEAGYCLSASAQKNDMRLVAVVVGAKTGQDRFKEVSALFNYGFANFANKLIVDKNVKIDSVEILRSKKKEVDILAKEDFYALTKKGESGQYETDVILNEKITAPLQKGTTVGKLCITKAGKVVKEIELIVSEDVEKLTFLDSLKEIASNW